MRKVGKSLISLVVTLLILEAVVRTTDVETRIFGDPYGKVLTMLTYIVPDAYLQWRGRKFMPMATFEEKLNTRGFRAPEVIPPKPPGVKRIAVLGDSASFGIVAVAVGHFATPLPYASILQDIFDQELGTGRVEVLNFAMIGYSTFQGIRVLKREVLPIEPDIVVIRFGWNDHMTSSLQRSYAVPRPLWKEKLQDLFFKSRFLTLLTYRGLPMDLMRKEQIYYAPGPNPIVWVKREDYAYHLSRMIDIAREHGARAILLDARPAPITPEILKDQLFVDATGYETLDQLLAAHASYQEIAARVAREKGVPFVRTDAPPDQAARNFSPVDIAHPSAEGHKWIAHRIHDEIADMVTANTSP
ncbi:MAG: SGNH/GDSL hydrolase family protein [Deltaproteobacteria bacterium]|nr:SGNH/GDSL hydrolase family protein [Deltaproteobacteria bacterium]